MKPLVIAVIILSIICLIFIGYFSYQQFGVYLNKVYTQGYNYGVQQTIVDINKNGLIPVIQNTTGNLTIKNIDIKTICLNYLPRNITQ